MEPGHRPAIVRTFESGPDNNIGSFSDAVYEVTELSQVIAAIGIGEDDHVSLSALKTAPHSQTIAAPGLEQHCRAGGCRGGWATVPRTIVDDDHLTSDPGNPQALECLLDHGHHAAQLIEARQYDRNARSQRKLATVDLTARQRDHRRQRTFFRNLHWHLTQLRTG